MKNNNIMKSELRLPLQKKWFEMTKAGLKTEDYREINEYWIKRFIDISKEPTWGINDFIREFEYHGNELGFIEKYGKKYTHNLMTLGYPSNDNTERILKLEHKGIEIRTGNTEWGADPGKKYFVILHGKIEPVPWYQRSNLLARFARDVNKALENERRDMIKNGMMWT